MADEIQTPDEVIDAAQEGQEIPTEQLFSEDERAWVDFNPAERPEGSLMHRQMGNYEVASGRDRGEERKNNEDKTRIQRLDKYQESLLILSDGVGGHGDGEVASQLATQVAREEYLRWRHQGLTAREALERAVKEANAAVNERNRQSGSDSGATMTAAVLNDNGEYLVANVGDSRAYKIDGRKAEKITTDHSAVESLVIAGQLSPEEVYTHPNRNIIYRVLGDKPDVEVDVFDGNLNDGEQLMLCSDGLWEMTKDADGRIIQRFARSSLNQREVVRRLMAKANAEGGEDNVSVIIARRTQEQNDKSENESETEASEPTGGEGGDDGNNTTLEEASSQDYEIVGQTEEGHNILKWDKDGKLYVDAPGGWRRYEEETQEDVEEPHETPPPQPTPRRPAPRPRPQRPQPEQPPRMAEAEIRAREHVYKNFQQEAQNLAEMYGGGKGEVKLPDKETKEKWAREMMSFGREVYELVEKTRLSKNKSLEEQLTELPDEVLFILHFSQEQSFDNVQDMIAFRHALEGGQKWLLYLGYAEKHGETVSLEGFTDFVEQDKAGFDAAKFNQTGINRSQQRREFDYQLAKWRSEGYLEKEDLQRLQEAQDFKEDVERRITGKGRVRWNLEKVWLNYKDSARALAFLGPSEEGRWMEDWSNKEKANYINRNIYAKRILSEIGENQAARRIAGERAPGLSEEEYQRAQQQEEFVDNMPSMLRSLGEMLIRMSGDFDEGDIEEFLRGAMGGELPAWGQEAAKKVSHRASGASKSALGVMSMLLMIFGAVFMGMGGERRRR